MRAVRAEAEFELEKNRVHVAVFAELPGCEKSSLYCRRIFENSDD
jgi:hypothetical protein